MESENTHERSAKNALLSLAVRETNDPTSRDRRNCSLTLALIKLQPKKIMINPSLNQKIILPCSRGITWVLNPK